MDKFNTTQIKQVQTQSLSRVIFTQLEEMILSGRIQPGERINESKLSALLGVSRAPIREACRQLERHGMVEVRANRGTFVNEINIKEVKELYDIRASLDALGGKKAAERITAKSLKELEHCLERMQQAVAADDVKDYYKVNLDFHMRIMGISGNNNLLVIIDGIYKKVSLFRKTSLSLPGRLSISFRQHQEIVTALGAKNPQAVARLMEHHVTDAKLALLSSIAD